MSCGNFTNFCDSVCLKVGINNCKCFILVPRKMCPGNRIFNEKITEWNKFVVNLSYFAVKYILYLPAKCPWVELGFFKPKVCTFCRTSNVFNKFIPSSIYLIFLEIIFSYGPHLPTKSDISIPPEPMTRDKTYNILIIVSHKILLKRKIYV